MMVNYKVERWCGRCEKKIPKSYKRCPECGCVLRRRPIKNRVVARI
jgi:hypothetical protein